MNYTNILACFGLDESSFIEKEVIPIQEGNTLVFYLTEAKKTCLCPKCKSNKIKSDGHYERRPNVGFIGSEKFILRVNRQRYKCLKCNKSFTLEINGLDNDKRVVNSIEKTILNEFRLPISFKQIAIQHSVSPTYVIKLFDQSFTGFPRASMPRVLCIDEFYFSKNNSFKFCCILIDYEKHKVIDIIESRKIDFLCQYFDNIPLQERDRVKFFVSDMYGPYEEICSRYFKKALYITDKFHYKKQISEAFKKYRVYVMNNIAGKFTPEYSFLKREWKLFQCDYFDVEDKVKGNLFKSKYMNYKEKYTVMILRCLKLDPLFSESYQILQDVIRKKEFKNYKEAKEFIEFIINRLLLTGYPAFIAVAKTYKEWLPSIAQALTPNEYGLNVSNGIAEGFNNKVKTIIKVSYGYSDYNRFRKRALLILRNMTI